MVGTYFTIIWEQGASSIFLRKFGNMGFSEIRILIYWKFVYCRSQDLPGDERNHLNLLNTVYYFTRLLPTGQQAGKPTKTVLLAA